MLLSVVVSAAVVAMVATDPASDQLPNYKRKNQCNIGTLTTSNGAPVEKEDINALNTPLIPNQYFMDTTSHLVRETIPVRVVHAKGAGAFGYFVVTHNITGICKAKLFSRLGMKTPVVVRFSETSLDKGETDGSLDARGFAVKFLTQEGNFDIVGFHTPMFLFKDPNIFHPIVRVIKRNPATNLRDAKMLWDLITLRPETVFFFMYLFADFGIPHGFRYMPGFSIHTYQLYNNCGESFGARFHFMPDLGIRNLFGDELAEVAKDPDFAVRDLYNAIERGDYPYWTVYVQALSLQDIENADFDVFDITKVLPEEQYPMLPVGKIFLDRNPKNFFAEVEQLAFCPSNLVPGILGAPDQIFTSRRFAYRDAQFYRLGANFNKIRVNCPRNIVMGYDRDGLPPVGLNGGDSPSYFPNSYHGPAPYCDSKRPKLLKVTHDESMNFEQAEIFYTELPNDQRSRMIANIVSSLSLADLCVQQRAIKIFNEIQTDLGYRIAAGLARKNL